MLLSRQAYMVWPEMDMETCY